MTWFLSRYHLIIVVIVLIACVCMASVHVALEGGRALSLLEAGGMGGGARAPGAPLLLPPMIEPSHSLPNPKKPKVCGSNASYMHAYYGIQLDYM